MLKMIIPDPGLPFFSLTCSYAFDHDLALSIIITTIIIIMHIYIAPEPGNPVLRGFTVLLSLTQSCFYPAHISIPKGAYNACCH